MSDNFDAARNLQPPRVAQPGPERRRSPRWNAHVPVFVYGHTATQDPFHEEAYSAVVSGCGALLIMTTAVPVGEKLLLTNKVTQVEQECRVASLGHQDGPNIEIAVEFTAEVSDFWRVTPGPQPVSSIAPSDIYKKAL